MQIKEITDKEIWEAFLSKQEEKTFFQSWNWGEFRRAVGEKIWRLGVYDNEELVAAALVSKKMAKRGTYLEVSHGPVGATRKEKVFAVLLKELQKLARGEQASFIRMNPLWERSEENISLFRNLGFRQAPTYASYESSWKLGITPAEDDLMKNMRKTTRYIIRQAEKNENILIRQSLEEKDREQFHFLSRAVGERQKFTPF